MTKKRKSRKRKSPIKRKSPKKRYFSMKTHDLHLTNFSCVEPIGDGDMKKITFLNNDIYIGSTTLTNIPFGYGSMYYANDNSIHQGIWIPTAFKPRHFILNRHYPINITYNNGDLYTSSPRYGPSVIFPHGKERAYSYNGLYFYRNNPRAYTVKEGKIIDDVRIFNIKKKL